MKWSCSVDFVLATVLLVAAAAKYRGLEVASPATAAWVVNRTVTSFLIQAELLLASWLLVGAWSRPRFLVATACFALFAVVASYEAFHAMPSCGCFGNVKVPPAITVGFDAAAVIALVMTRKGMREEHPSRSRVIAGVSVAGVLSAALWTTYFLKPSPAAADDGGSLVVLDPPSWVGQAFPLMDEISDSARPGSPQALPLRSGRWIVLFYHYDCDDCLAAIPAYRALAESHGGPWARRVAFVAMPPVAPAGQEPVAESSDYLKLSLKTDHDWFATTPVVVIMDDGRVTFAADGEKAVHPPDDDLLAK